MLGMLIGCVPAVYANLPDTRYRVHVIQLRVRYVLQLTPPHTHTHTHTHTQPRLGPCCLPGQSVSTPTGPRVPSHQTTQGSGPYSVRGIALPGEVREALCPHWCLGTQQPWDALSLGPGRAGQAQTTLG